MGNGVRELFAGAEGPKEKGKGKGKERKREKGNTVDAREISVPRSKITFYVYGLCNFRSMAMLRATPIASPFQPSVEEDQTRRATKISD